MASRLTLAVVGAFSISLLLVGGGGAAVCDPHCAPSQSNTNRGGEVKGLNRANSVADDHGQQGRDNAAAKQDLHKPGGSGVPTSAPPVPPPPVPPPVVEPPVVPPPSPCTGC